MNAELAAALQRKIQITAACRYVASRRLIYHNRLSRWTTALASATLMVLPILGPLGAGNQLGDSVLRLVQFSLALFMLVYSLLVSGEDYSLEADRMHRCGVELTSLALQLGRYIERGNLSDLKKSEEKYYTILKNSPNHTEADYYTASLQRTAKGEQDANWKQVVRWRVGAILRGTLGYLHYLVVWVIFGYLVYTLLR